MNTPLLRLQSLLEKELVLVQQFISVLQLEANALTQADGNEALNASTAQKNHFAALLTESETSREAQLKELGFDSGKNGLDAACAAYPELQDTCQELYALAAEANQINSANGAIIDTFLQHNQQALDTLRSLANMGNLYDASGRTKTAASSKKGIKAG
ncbi:MAG TPA: flagellar protein FlgN [Eoetvoesiella sp.]